MNQDNYEKTPTLSEIFCSNSNKIGIERTTKCRYYAILKEYMII